MLDERDAAYNAQLAQLLGDGTHSEQRRCPDQYVGLIGGLGQDGSIFAERRDLSERPEGVKCLFVILESPHVDEYESQASGAQLPCPANGYTGERIALYLPSMGFDPGLGVVLLNAVPFQCSLGNKPPGVHRDREFAKLWNAGGRSYFQSRLRQAFRAGDSVLNCCTKGAKRPHLRELVQLAIEEVVDANLVQRSTHPSSWYSRPGSAWPWTSQKGE